jgi:glycosyltransferase involved in cell wall biosynthesis
MVMLHFIEWLKKQPIKVDFDVISLRDGELNDVFKRQCSNYISLYINADTSIFARAINLIAVKIFKQNSFYKNWKLKNVLKKKYDIIYANSILSLPLANEIKIKNQFHPKLLVHVHELNSIIRLFNIDLNKYKSNVDCFIAVSQAVFKNLEEEWSINPERIELVYEASDIKPFDTRLNNNRRFIIGASGHVHWRKGYDIFIYVAAFIQKHYQQYDMDFVWVGEISHENKIIVDEDIRKLGLTGKVFFKGNEINPFQTYSDFDIFLLPSKEDPFPLVCIEVGLMGKPIICFEKATGTAEMVQMGGGYVVPYLDIEAMAEKVIEYYNNRDLIKKHGDANINLFARFKPEVICPEYYKILSRLVNE